MTLDEDQAGALRRFADDLREVIAHGRVPAGYARRLMEGLVFAYRVALAAGSWTMFVALLSSALDDLEAQGYAPHPGAGETFARLRLAVRDNADLLPPEMAAV